MRRAEPQRRPKPAGVNREGGEEHKPGETGLLVEEKERKLYKVKEAGQQPET